MDHFQKSCCWVCMNIQKHAVENAEKLLKRQNCRSLLFTTSPSSFCTSRILTQNPPRWALLDAGPLGYTSTSPNKILLVRQAPNRCYAVYGLGFRVLPWFCRFASAHLARVSCTTSSKCFSFAEYELYMLILTNIKQTAPAFRFGQWAFWPLTIGNRQQL